MFLCDDDVFKDYLKEAFIKIMGREVDYELVSYKQTKENGQYYPPTSIFGMEVTVDDTDFE